jgi:hypothetical protein
MSWPLAFLTMCVVSVFGVIMLLLIALNAAKKVSDDEDKN